jgi:hypothetical protein
MESESMESIDEPVRVDGDVIQLRSRLWRHNTTSLSDLAVGDDVTGVRQKESARCMVVETTGVGGEFAKAESGRAIGHSYFHPSPADIPEDEQHVVLRDVKSGVMLPLSEQRLEELILDGVLEVS